MCIWFHLSMIMRNKIHPWPSLIWYVVPWAIQPPPSMQSLTFQVPWYPLYWVIHPLARLSRSKDTKTKAYPYLETIILVIEFSQKSMDIIRYQCPTTTLLLKYFTNVLLHVLIHFSNAANPCSQFQPPDYAFPCFPIPIT